MAEQQTVFNRLTITTGKTGVGKTKRNIYKAVNKAVKENKKILHLTFEEGVGTLHNMYLSTYMYVTKGIEIGYNTIASGDYTSKQKKQLQDNWLEIRDKGNIETWYLLDAGYELSTKLEEVIKENKHDVIIIDSPFFVPSTSQEEASMKLVENITKVLTAMTETEVWLVSPPMIIPRDILEEATIVNIVSNDKLKGEDRIEVWVNVGLNGPRKTFTEKVNFGIGYFNPSEDEIVTEFATASISTYKGEVLNGNQ